MKVDKAYEALQGHVQRVAKYIPVKLDRIVEDILEAGFCYISGFDRCLRPIVVLQPKVMASYKNLEESKFVDAFTQAQVAVFQFIVDHIFVPGKVEQWIVIVDNKDLKMSDFETKRWTAINNNCDSLYLCRANRIITINGSTALSWGWKIYKNFLNPAIVQITESTTHPTTPYIEHMIHPSQLQEKHLGEQPDLEKGEYWPFRQRSQTYGIDFDSML